MGEDFPLDPNQVQPPQEVQEQQPQEQNTGHIEVAYHDEGQQAIDVPQAVIKSVNNPETEDTKPASTPEPEGPDFIKNKDKAEAMAHAQNDAFDYNDGKTREEWQAGRYSEDNKPMWKSPEQDANEAGKDHDLETALSKEWYSHIKTPEQAREFASKNRNIFLKYSHAIAESHKEFGEQLSPNLRALALVSGLVGDVGYEEFNTKRANYDEDGLKIELDKSGSGAIVVTTRRHSGKPKEEWRLPMFSNGGYTPTRS